MIQNLLHHQWGIWFIFQGESYEGNVYLAYHVSSPSDLAFLWKNTPIVSLTNYFLNEDLTQKAYQIDHAFKKVNSIEFFRNGIQPKWEDPKNQNGGRFVFQIYKSQENKCQIYANIVFQFLGQDFDHSEKVNGIRFISSKNPNSVSYRVEVWVDFNKEDIENMKHYQKLFGELFKTCKLSNENINFFNMKPEDKDKGKGEVKEK